MRRVVSLFLPNWSTDRLRRKAGDAALPPETPLVLIGREGSRCVVTAVDAAAHTAGLRTGIPVTKAQILVPGLITMDADPIADAEALQRLALWVLQRVAPIVASDPPAGIVIDSTGADHLHGGEHAMVDALIGRLTMSGVTARAAVADSWAAAHALARFAADPIVIAPPGHGAAVLDRLPLAALRLPHKMVSDLRILGFERIRDLLAQPRAPLTLRLVAKRSGPSAACATSRCRSSRLRWRARKIVPEIAEPAVSLRPMTAGSEVVEDYGHTGLSLRAHPVSFLRDDLRHCRIVSCAEAMDARDGQWLEAAGIILVRQRPGSAKGVLFVTLQDETGIANLVVWPKVFEANRRILLSAGMLSVRGRIQREGAVVHLVAQRITDLSADLASVGARAAAFPLPYGRGDQVRHGGSGPDPREISPRSLQARNFYDNFGHIEEIRVKNRKFK
ncbi:hypothetical protein J2S34_002283 [Nitrobacter winogradskyi]|uniref:Uncharacterized protein n=2 Tax=Nitrobacter winogradskyi TaxID=913 RepID=A0ACC6ALT6_NITWI|nr:DNA polymerase Y family protein [Nitrobacter winogradskyi]MCP1999835.1 hypothetical protein [Nitrobacter winogradskyi]GEC17590.1 hypothetical protein NWI01_34820 [Nitrobacter winogradskyi]